MYVKVTRTEKRFHFLIRGFSTGGPWWPIEGVMALGHYMREKSTESQGDSPAESTQTAETIESGSAGTARKMRKGGQKQGKKPKGESRNK